MKQENLFVTDLDGTLFHSNVTVSEYTTMTINKLINAGYYITFCTARSYYMARKIMNKINFNVPCIVFNGAYIIDCMTGEKLVANSLQKSLCIEVLEDAKKIGIVPFVFGQEKDEEVLKYVLPENKGQKNFIMQRKKQKDKRLRFVNKIELPDEIITLNFIEKESQLRKLKKICEKKYENLLSIKFAEDIYLKGFFSLELSNHNADKGKMIKVLAKYMDIPLQNVVVFGDHLNDLTMFKVAGRTIAVKNAHREILNFADEHIASNNEDGVARYLENNLLNKFL
ncbi:phosphatase [Bacillus sp. J14TS2]|uniref:HAD family hydrolase n=1 Tax=Bacillus sp. J14TS2 TaxID=2807188 RepID=UPI001B162481|nr:HAD family hydrolase [Bacillus sp. J14TS2]GIN74413.1 phosphatase [Bacillus sp. J14TS2]